MIIFVRESPGAWAEDGCDGLARDAVGWQAAGGDMLALWAEATGRRRAAG